MSSLNDLRAGDIMFSNISGAPGLLVKFGQWLLAKTERDELNINHVGVVVQAAKGIHQWPLLVQAMPHGAEEIELNPEKHWTKGQVYLRPRYGMVTRLEGLTRLSAVSQGINVATSAKDYIGTPYSFADYAAILGLHLGVRNGLVRRYVTSSKHMICSQLADQALSDAGFHVFTDGRLPQDVMPIELFRALKLMPGTEIIQP